MWPEGGRLDTPGQVSQQNIFMEKVFEGIVRSYWKTIFVCFKVMHSWHAPPQFYTQIPFKKWPFKLLITL